MGEKIAQTYLQLIGFKIVDCNFRIKEGEIDIIAEKSNIIHFVEVKTRKNKYIMARQSIGNQKCNHIWKVAEYYLYKKKIINVECQIDAIEVYIEENSLQINFIPRIIEK